MYVYQSKNGLSWVRVGSIGPGSSNNKGIYWNNGTNLVNNTLYVGTFNLADGAELLKFCPTTASCK
jgi:hypothetical protein